MMFASVSTRILGALFKIPLAAMIGGEGMGYYMTAYTVIGPAFSISVMGFSMAISKLCSTVAAKSRIEEINKYFISALILFTSIGISFAVIIYISAPSILKIIGNEAALKAVRSMIPALIFCCISSVFRGYYEGQGNMLPTALSQITEAVIKLICGLGFSHIALKKSIEEFTQYGTVMGEAAKNLNEALAVAAPNAAAAAIAGVSVSTAAGCIISILFYNKNGLTKSKSSDKVITFTEASSELIRTAIPFSAAALVVNMSSIADTISVINILNKTAVLNWDMLISKRPELLLSGIEPERAANFLYGSYTGLAMTIFNLAPAFTASLAVCTLPMISSLYAKGKSRLLSDRIKAVLRITSIIAIPIGIGMSVMSDHIVEVLFSSNIYEVSVASDLLKVLGIAAIFVSVSSVTNSVLQAIGRIYTPLKLIIAGSFIKLTINWLLISIPEINILGAPLGTLFCYLFIMLTGILIIAVETNININLLSIIIKPTISALICCASAKLLIKQLEKSMYYTISTLISIMFGIVIYIVFLVILKGFGESELELLGNNSKLNKLLYFYKLIPCKSHCNAVK